MKALILIDFQKDFFPFGTVEAVGADEQLVATANRLMECFDCVVALSDEHPGDHNSFAANHLWRRPWQTMKLDAREILLWPMHCVAGSFGAEWADGLRSNKITRVFSKGVHPDALGYSGFESETLGYWLKTADIHHLYLMGPLLEYSIKHTALDALAHGFTVAVIRDGCAYLDRQPGDAEHCWEELLENGVKEVISSELCPES